MSNDLLNRIAEGRTDLVFEFLDAGGAATSKDQEGVSLLQWCSYYGDVSAIRFLLAHGESLQSLGDLYGLNTAAFHGHSRLCEYVRNPMYVGVLTTLLGEVLYFESWALLQYTMVWLLIVHLFVVLYEEPKLRRQFGSFYEEYSCAVRRWLPGRACGTSSGRVTHRETAP